MSHWLIQTGDRTEGPISYRELADLYQSGQYSEETLVCQEGMSQWQPVDTVPGISRKRNSTMPPLASASPARTNVEKKKRRAATVTSAPRETSTASRSESSLMRVRRTFVYVVLVCVCGACDQSPSSPGTAVSIPVTTLQVAEITETLHVANNRVFGAVNLKNTGEFDAHVTNATTGCGCTNFDLSDRVIRAGATATLRLTLDPNLAGPSVFSTAIDKGKCTATLSCRLFGNFSSSNEPDGLAVVMTDDVPLPFTASAAVDFGPVPISGGPTSQRVDIQFRSSPYDFHVACPLKGVDCHLTDISGRRGTLLVTIDPVALQSDALAKRPHLRRIELTQQSQPEQLRRVNIPMVYSLVPPIQCEPRRIMVGPVDPYEETACTLKLIPDDVSITKITSVDLADSDPEVVILNQRMIERGLVLNLIVTPTAIGIRHKHLPCRVIVNDGEERLIEVPMTIVGRSKAKAHP